MVVPNDVASNRIVHASPVSQVIPGYPDRTGAHRGKELKENDLDCPSHKTAKGRAISPIRNAPAPMPIAPAIMPVCAVPTVTAALGYPLDRRIGAEFGFGIMPRP
jgi:hypothetical protein